MQQAFLQCARFSVRLLHAGHDHDGSEPQSGAAAGSAAGRSKGNICRCTGYGAIENAIRGVRAIETAEAGDACGRSVPAPAARAVISGTARYTLDFAPAGLLHLKLLRSPHAHARITSIRKDAALAVPGVRAVLTWEDAPAKLYSTARHEDETRRSGRHRRARPDRPLCRPARRGGRRRKRGGGGGRLPQARGRLRIASGGVRSRGSDAARRAGHSRQRPGGPHRTIRSATSSARSMAMSATSKQALPKPTSSTKAPTSPSASSTRIWKHTAPSAGLTKRGGSTSARARRRRS